MSNRSQSGKHPKNTAGPSREVPRAAGRRKGRLLIIGATCGVVVVGVFVANWYRRVDEGLERRVDGEATQRADRTVKPLVASDGSLAEPSAVPPQPATPPPEPSPLPPEPSALPPERSVLPPASSAPPAEPAATLQFTEESLHKEALQAVSRLIEDFPNSPDPLGLMGNLHVALGNTAEAVKCWERCVELDPNRVDSYRCMCLIALRKGEFQKAAALSRKALAIDAATPRVHNLLAQALIGLGQPEEAIAALEEDIKITPKASLSYFLLGQAHQQLKEYPKAKENYQKAFQIDPHYTEACYALTIVCARLGQKDEATEYREKFKQLKARDWRGLSDPRDSLDEGKFLLSLRRGVAQSLAKVGLFYRQQGHGSKAEELWRRAAILDPRNTECREELASLYVEKGRDEEALRVCKQLRQIAPKNPQYCLNTGILYARMNQMDAALAAVKRAVEIDPRNVEYRRTYERMKKGG